MPISTSDKSFKERIDKAKEDTFMQRAVEKSQDGQWEKREGSRERIGNWEQWRELGEQIRQHTITHLDYYLEQFSDNVAKRGGHVFFAETAEDASNYIEKVIEEKKAKKIVKAKSMVTEEIGMNEMIRELSHIEFFESDLAEFILQEDDWDAPSHIVFPDIHKNRQQIRKVFHEKLGYDGDDNPQRMARFVRGILRKHFLEADIGITGCNFAIANSGQVNLVTNEGNADLVESIPKTQIVVMGMERIVPNIEDAEVLDNLLARSAVGQDLTTYITFAGPKLADENDGPEDFHVVIVDNGRSKVLGTEFQSILQCIRCGACLNVCPVYRHIGGHGYGSIYPGPVGAILSPIIGGYEEFKELPFASSLCGACTDTCPVKIPLHNLLIEHRRVLTDDKKMMHGFNDVQMRAVALGTAKPFLFKSALKVAHFGSGILTSHDPVSAINFSTTGVIKKGPGMVKGWTDVRDMTRPVKEKDNFRTWFKTREKQRGENNDANS